MSSGDASRAPLALASYKINVRESRARLVPSRGLDGCAFAGPGVDVLGDAFEPLRALLAPAETWIREREPGLVLRSMSIDREKLRVLLSLDPLEDGRRARAVLERPNVLRLDPPGSTDLIERLGPLEAALGALARSALERRG